MACWSVERRLPLPRVCEHAYPTNPIPFPKKTAADLEIPLRRYDAACHLSEEIPDPARNVPLAMVGSTVANGLIGLAYCIMLLFATGPLDELLATSTGFPYMQIFYSSTGGSAVGATLLSLTITLTAIAAVVAGIASTSRTLWAFARDAATPWHAAIGRVDGAHAVPTMAIVVVTVLQVLLGFIYLGNSTAFNAILAMAVIGMYMSYLLPVVYMLLGRSRLAPADYGPFRLGGPLGIVCNVVSVIWLVVSIIFSTFPSAIPVTAANMNYSSVVMVGWTVFGAIYYLVWGWKEFRVPEIGKSGFITGVAPE
jgi:choline transport protein